MAKTLTPDAAGRELAKVLQVIRREREQLADVTKERKGRIAAYEKRARELVDIANGAAVQVELDTTDEDPPASAPPAVVADVVAPPKKKKRGGGRRTPVTAEEANANRRKAAQAVGVPVYTSTDDEGIEVVRCVVCDDPAPCPNGHAGELFDRKGAADGA